MSQVSKHIHRDPARITTSLVDLRPLSINVHCIGCDRLVDGPCAHDSEVAAQANGITESRFLWCRDCKDWAQFCAICQTSVRGIHSVCAQCGHGGHPAHMKSWFERYSECPTGCGCRCTLSGRSGAGDDSDSDEERRQAVEDEDIYERDEDAVGLFGSTPQRREVSSGSLYDTYDFNRPHYIEGVLSESNYREFNYNNFYETMQDLLAPGSILEEGDFGSDEDEE